MIEKKELMENELSENFSQLTDSVEEVQDDFNSFSIDELVKYLESLNIREKHSRANVILSQVKSSFDFQYETLKEGALQKFLNEGGVEADFELKKDDNVVRFEKIYSKVKAELLDFFSELEKNKVQNLKIKNDLLARLRKLVSADGSTLSLDEFKNIQEEWKKTGQVPPAQSNELWNNYKALVDIFYNNRDIFFELKELDRKKNLEAKKEICEKVEGLISLTSVAQALKELKNLHEDFRHIGPVPKEEQESLWNRLKLASDKIYEKRKEYLQEQKLVQENNLQQKKSILEKMESLVTFESSRIDDWKLKTSEVQKIQEEWRTAGTVAQDKAKELSNKFWDLCKVYYKRKNEFFKELDKKREENLVKKIALCETVEAFKNSTQGDDVLRDIKEIQKKWEKIGQIPFKQKDKVFNRFKEACDFHFNKKRAQQAEAEQEYLVNHDKKLNLIAEIKTYISGSEPKTIEKLKEYQLSWDSIGFVPKDKKKSISDAFNDVMSKYIDASSEIEQDAKMNIRLSLEVMTMKSSQEGLDQLKKKEQAVQKKIALVKSEIERYKTNIEFFGRSKGAEKMKEEIQLNIDNLEIELNNLKQELKIIKS